MMPYRACALLLSLAAVTIGVALFSPGTGAALTGRTVMMRLAQDISASEQPAKSANKDAVAPLKETRGKSAVKESMLSQALQSRPQAKPDRAQGRTGPKPIPDGTSFTSPVEGAPAGDSAGDGANENADSSGVGDENGQAAEDNSATGATGDQAKPPDNKKELADILAGYHSRIVELIKAKKQYPQIARRLGHQGIVRLSFSLSSNGELISSSVSKSSGFEELDKAALNSLKAVSRFPAFPSQLGPESRAFVVSLSFTID